MTGIILPDVASVNRKVKKVPYADLTGVQRNAKTGWLGCPSDGVTRKIFSARPDYTTETYGNSYSSAGFDLNGLMYISADQGSHSKIAGAAVIFTAPLQLSHIQVEHIPTQVQEMTSIADIWVTTYNNANSIIEQKHAPSSSTIISTGTAVKKFSLAISSDGSGWGYYYIKPTFVLPDGSTFDLT